MDKNRKDLVELAVAARLYIEAETTVATLSDEEDKDDVKTVIATTKTAFERLKQKSTRINMTLVDDTLDLAHKYKEEHRRQTQQLETQTKTRMKNEP